MKAAKLLALMTVVALVGVAVIAQDTATRPRGPRGLRGQIVKVEAGKITVKPMVRPGGEAREDVVVTTGEKTTVTIDEKEAKVADLKADMWVVVTPMEGTAEKIVASTKPPTRPSGSMPASRRARPMN